MSSTDDSGINARSHTHLWARGSRSYSHTTDYGTVASSVEGKAQYHLTATKEIVANPQNPAARKILQRGETASGACRREADWKFTSITSASCCGVDIGERRRRRPTNRGCVVFIVFLALLLDSLLLTAMVPIIPNYLRDLSSHKIPASNISNVTVSTARIAIPGRALSTEVSLGAKGSQDNSSHAQKKVELYRPIFKKPTARPSQANSTYTKENTKIGLLFGSKTFVQVLCNLIVGPLTERIGYTVPLFSGFIVLLLSTIAFAFGNTYELLFAARAFQGVGTALSTTSGMGLLASLYPDQTERTAAQTKAFSGLALGVLLGPPYGGILYNFLGGKEIPCLILALTALFEGALQMHVMRPRIEREPVAGASTLTLLTDPYIIVTAAAITISNLTTAVLEASLPIWMFHRMGAEIWLQGVAFVPSTLSYLIFLQVFGFLTSKMQCFKVTRRWFCTMLGMIVLAVSISMVPYCPDIYILIAPLLIMGFGLAQVSVCMLPHIGTLVDHRHQPVYGSAYAITDNAFALAFAVGPAISGPLIDIIGFTWALRGVTVIIVMFLPLLFTLRNPPGKENIGKEESVTLVPESTKATIDYCAGQTVTTEQ